MIGKLIAIDMRSLGIEEKQTPWELHQQSWMPNCFWVFSDFWEIVGVDILLRRGNPAQQWKPGQRAEV